MMEKHERHEQHANLCIWWLNLSYNIRVKMGFSILGLSPTEQMDLRAIEPELINALKKAAARIIICQANSKLWFGDCSQQWIDQLRMRLIRMACILNIQTILCQSIRIDEQSNAYAHAIIPRYGWRDYTINQHGDAFLKYTQDQWFCIRLDRRWNTAPLFKNNFSPISKFQTIAHEITHIFMNTRDIAYGVIDCCELAIANPNDAKLNADNWMYFIDEYSLLRYVEFRSSRQV